MMNRIEPYLLPGVIVTVLVALGVLVALNTEWVDVDVPRPLRGAAAADDLYILQRVLQDLGVRTERHDDLAQLPPPGSPLLLDEWMWGVLPERDHALENWVRSGGRLIINGDLLTDRSSSGPAWLPVSNDWTRPARQRQAAPNTPADKAGGGGTEVPGDREQKAPPLETPLAPAIAARDNVKCDEVAETGSAPPAYPESLDADGKPGPLSLCGGSPSDSLRSRLPTLWSLETKGHATLLRVAVDSGTVTVLPRARVFHNRLVLRGDNAAIAVAALQASAGATVWLVAERSRSGLIAWVWENGAAVVLFSVVALGLWLWRASDRFGPRAPLPAHARRSMVEQIRGTAAFLWTRNPGALHAAQMRALEDAARRRIRDYRRLDPAARIAALARASGMDPAAIGPAMDAHRACQPGQLAQVLATLESLRRSLQDKPRPGQPAATPTSQESSS